MYPKILPYIKQIGKSKYGIDFLIKEDTSETLEFWDSNHLSPKGESQYSEFLFNSIIHLIN